MNSARRFEQLFTDAAPKIRGILIRHLGDRTLAEDFLNEVFFIAWRQFAKLDASRDPLPWLRTVAVNLVIDHLRKQRLRPTPVELLAAETAVTSTTPPPFDLEDELRSLSPLDRGVLLLHYQEGMAVLEIAAKLNVPLGTVKTWLHRARGRLRIHLAPEFAPHPKDPES